jgi:hypothetical protein
MTATSQASPQSTAASSSEQRPSEIADARGWRDLGLVTLFAAVTIWRWHWLGWLWGALVLLLFLRAGALVLSARAASADPEERLGEPDKKDGSSRSDS